MNAHALAGFNFLARIQNDSEFASALLNHLVTKHFNDAFMFGHPELYSVEICGVNVNDNLLKLVRTHLSMGNPIEAIRNLRLATGTGLKYAKDAVEYIRNNEQFVTIQDFPAIVPKL